MYDLKIKIKSRCYLLNKDGGSDDEHIRYDQCSTYHLKFY